MRSDSPTALLFVILLPASAHAFQAVPQRSRAIEASDHSIALVVDQDRIDGSMKKLKGSVKETVGKVTGDRKMQSSGAREKATGKVQKAIGGFKDSVREIIGK